MDSQSQSSGRPDAVQYMIHGTPSYAPQPVPAPYPSPLGIQNVTPTAPGSVREPQSSHFLDPRTESFLDWILKVLAVASAILFGIWAPISYKATSDGNAENNASQNDVKSALSDLREQATNRHEQVTSLHEQVTSLYEQVTSQVDEISSLNEKIEAIGVLRVWEFCQGLGTDVAACEGLIASMTIDSYVSSLAAPAIPRTSTIISTRSTESTMISTRYSTSSTITQPAGTDLPTASRTSYPGGDGSNSNGSSLSDSQRVGVILGAIFGGITVFGFAVITVLAMRVKRSKSKAQAKSRNTKH